MNEQQQKMELLECLYRLGFEKELVEGLLSKLHFPNDRTFDVEIKNLKIEEDFFIDLIFCKPSSSDRYLLDEIRAVQHQQQKIAHTDINGISTAELEQQMKTLDWRRNYSELEHGLMDREPQEQLLYSRYLSAIHNVIMLAADEPLGKDISNELKLRHLLATPYEEKFVFGHLLEGKSQGRVFYLDEEEGLSLPQMKNILAGRSVLWDLGDFMEGGKSWLCLNIKGQDDPARCTVSIMFNKQRRHSDYDLGSVLSNLPIVYSESFGQEQLLEKLKQGDLVEIQMVSNEKISTYAVAADPAAKSVFLYNDKGKQIAVTSIMGTIKTLHQQHEPDQANGKVNQQRKRDIIKPGRKKGKGL